MRLDDENGIERLLREKELLLEQQKKLLEHPFALLKEPLLAFGDEATALLAEVKKTSGERKVLEISAVRHRLLDNRQLLLAARLRNNGLSCVEELESYAFIMAESECGKEGKLDSRPFPADSRLKLYTAPDSADVFYLRPTASIPPKTGAYVVISVDLGSRSPVEGRLRIVLAYQGEKCALRQASSVGQFDLRNLYRSHDFTLPDFQNSHFRLCENCGGMRGEECEEDGCRVTAAAFIFTSIVLAFPTHKLDVDAFQANHRLDVRTELQERLGKAEVREDEKKAEEPPSADLRRDLESMLALADARSAHVPGQLYRDRRIQLLTRYAF